MIIATLETALTAGTHGTRTLTDTTRTNDTTSQCFCVVQKEMKEVLPVVNPYSVRGCPCSMGFVV